MKTCDHTAVGVDVLDPFGRHLLIARGRPPFGRAPVAGHGDGQPPYAAACAELREEVGLDLNSLDDVRQAGAGHVPNICCRPPSHPVHDGHDWTIWQAHAGWEPQLVLDPDEVTDASWYTDEQLNGLAARTERYAQGFISEPVWRAWPGLEPVWVHWFARLGYVRDSPIVRKLYMSAPAR